MHEHKLVTRLIDEAQRVCRARGAALRAVRVRLGAMASDPAHFAEEFEHVCGEHGLGAIALHLEHAPERPSGIELIGVECEEVAER
jgi:Zn finger protein HypA/HybF involved in hydrogenase expression